ncbi:hypothetical protein V502_04468 [Pseudogymnoascus sp. VKM F-4520 (FW-2644)]|nr:hypothetical protein V502_04468 [Pseudogymnoascus sp. VKM F-4520 (FW-2644)]
MPFTTDIQPSNIFVKVRDYTRIESGYLVKAPIPQQDKAEKRYTVIRSCPLRQYYFTNDDRFDHFDIVLGDWGVASWADNHLTEIIQPLALRAPEVLIGAPWDATADLWNLGAVVLEMFRAIRMFSGEYPQGHYKLEQHLAEIVHLCGPFPKALLDKADQDIVGDIFDDQGIVKNAQLSPDKPVLSSEEYTPGLEQDDREEFVSFLQSLMKIDPMERPSPEDLLRGRWLYALPSL